MSVQTLSQFFIQRVSTGGQRSYLALARCQIRRGYTLGNFDAPLPLNRYDEPPSSGWSRFVVCRHISAKAPSRKGSPSRSTLRSAFAPTIAAMQKFQQPLPAQQVDQIVTHRAVDLDAAKSVLLTEA